MAEKKKIFVVITQTGTLLSKIVKRVTHDQYNHVSISLSENLDTLYAFGRRHPYNAFVGGFVQETPTGGTFGRFKNTDAIVLEKEIDSLVYDEIKLELERLYKNRNDYKYNYLGLLAGFFGKNIHMKMVFVQRVIMSMQHIIIWQIILMEFVQFVDLNTWTILVKAM